MRSKQTAKKIRKSSTKHGSASSSKTTDTRGSGSSGVATRSSKAKATSNQQQQQKATRSSTATESSGNQPDRSIANSTTSGPGQKRKAAPPNSQQQSKRQKTPPLTTDDIPTIIKAIKDAFPNQTRATEETKSDDSDEFGEHTYMLSRDIDVWVILAHEVPGYYYYTRVNRVPQYIHSKINKPQKYS